MTLTRRKATVVAILTTILLSHLQLAKSLDNDFRLTDFEFEVNNEFRLTDYEFALIMISDKLFTLVSDTDKYRTIDGSKNNKHHHDWGMKGMPVTKRTSPPSDYARNLPNPRLISNQCLDDGDEFAFPAPNEMGASDMLVIWGQFLDHDMVLTESDSRENMNIAIPRGDPVFDPHHRGNEIMPFSRSAHTNIGGKSTAINSITSYIDGSQVYGSDSSRASALRSFQDGRLRVSSGDHLPKNILGLPNAPHSSLTDFSLAGDIRANENVALQAMHTIWVREHNRIAGSLAMINPHWGDESIYQAARMIVGAEIQAITYNEFLDNLLGINGLPEYKGYNKTCNAAINDEFATAAFRLGHTLVSKCVAHLGKDMKVTNDNCIPLVDAFFSSEKLEKIGIDHIMRGLAGQMCQGMDHRIVHPLRNMLFKDHGFRGLDLAAINIQRGRDHSLGTYNHVRESFGLKARNTFREITPDPMLARDLEVAYGNVDNVDPWVGMICEPTVYGAMVGETIHAIIIDQFVSLRDCDRFWYQRHIPQELLQFIDETKLSDIIRLNSGVGEEMPPKSMIEPVMFNGGELF